MGKAMTTPRFIRWFRDIGIADVGLAGGKNASLGEMYRELTPEGIRVPNGFAVTNDRIRSILQGLDTRNLADLAERGRRVREAMLATPLPEDLHQAITQAYAELCRKYGPDTDTAVRSSATAEDLPTASFAGQQESFLNVRGDRALLEAVRACFASLFTDRAISYRVDKRFDHFAVALSVGVQKMVRSDRGAAGVLFTLDTESGFPDVVLINSSYGLGESVVKGRVDPDEFLVFKPTLKQGCRPILRRALGAKQEKLAYATRGGRSTRVMVNVGNLEQAFRLAFLPNDGVGTEEFTKVFDGFSIGSNDLTQLTLGLDRDSEIVAHLFDERNPAVTRLIEDVIRRAKACGRKIGICGQAPSDYPKFARFLVRCGIDSISLNSDTVLRTTADIVKAERELQQPTAAPQPAVCIE
jgi:phosphoenolpyruvate synthase/pyruvate phosphate dikinase